MSAHDDRHLLAAALPVPENPVETSGAESWADVEASLSARLPEDYQWFVATYGTGCVRGFLWVLNPFTTNVHLELRAQVEAQRDQHARRWEGGDPPFSFHPEPEGLMPVALTDNGDSLHWQCVGDPGDWPLVLANWRRDVVEHHEGPLTALILAYAEGDLTSELLDTHERVPTFEPLSPR